MSSTLTRNAVVLVTTNAGSALIGFAVVTLLARGLGEAGFGRYSLVVAWTLSLLPLAEFGLNPVMVRQVAASPDAARSQLPNTLAAKFALGLPIAAGLWLLAPWLLPGGGSLPGLSEYLVRPDVADWQCLGGTIRSEQLGSLAKDLPEPTVQVGLDGCARRDHLRQAPEPDAPLAPGAGDPRHWQATCAGAVCQRACPGVAISRRGRLPVARRCTNKCPDPARGYGVLLVRAPKPPPTPALTRASRRARRGGPRIRVWRDGAGPGGRRRARS